MLGAMRSWVVLLAAGCAHAPSAPPPAPPPPAPLVEGALRPPSAFAGIADRTARSRALFGEAARVLTSPRCVNCHPPDDSPRQGDAHVIHDPPVTRGPEDRGVPALRCTTCHQDHNLELARIPGAPNWHLAPLSMAWLGKTPGQICELIVANASSGGRTLDQVEDHVAHDRFVAWGFSPGADRTPAPGSQAELAALVQAWIDTGAACPEEGR